MAALLSACMADNKLVKADAAIVLAGIVAAQNADAIMELPVLFYVTNNGPEAVELLKWNTPLEAVLSADVFTVTRDGEAVGYIGRTMKRASPGAGDFVVLDPGARKEALIDIARYYDAGAAGEYQIAFTPLGGAEGYVNNGVAVAIEPSPVTVARD